MLGKTRDHFPNHVLFGRPGGWACVGDASICNNFIVDLTNNAQGLNQLQPGGKTRVNSTC